MGKASTAYSSTIELGQNFGSGGSSQVVPASQSYALTTSWQKFTFNIVLPSISGKTIGTSSYLYIAFIRSLPASNVDIDIAQMQLEIGSVATPFEHRSYGEELSLCQWYFQSLGGSGTNYILASGFTSTNTFFGQGKLSKTMRSSPTFSVSGTNSHFGYTHVAVAATANGVPSVSTTPETFYIQVGSNNATTSNAGAYIRITNSATKAHFDSEL